VNCWYWEKTFGKIYTSDLLGITILHLDLRYYQESRRNRHWLSSNLPSMTRSNFHDASVNLSDSSAYKMSFERHVPLLSMPSLLESDCPDARCYYLHCRYDTERCISDPGLQNGEHYSYSSTFLGGWERDEIAEERNTISDLPVLNAANRWSL